MSEEDQQIGAERFGHCLAFAFAVFLAISFRSQVTWFPKLSWHEQPGLWPLIAVFGMVVTGAVLAVRAFRRPFRGAVFVELRFWLHAGEYVVWFLVYVFVVPYIGYLPATIAFTVLLTLREGYRRWTWIAAATVMAVATVVVFRTLLHVAVPAGALYEALPQPLSGVLLTYF